MNKLDWQYQTHLRARYLFEQMEEMLRSAPNEEEKRQFLSSPDNYYLRKLNEIYTDDFQLAILMDKSDVLFHAEGDAASHDAPELSAVSWLTKVAQASFRKISRSYLSKHLDSIDLSSAIKKIDFRFNGYAPGSIYLGFSVEDSDESGFHFQEEGNPIVQIRHIIKSLSDIPGYIVNNHVDKKAILELIDDPAMRDTALQVSYDLSPTGRSGIDELSVANSERRKGTFTQVTKRYFKEAIANPMSHGLSKGSFFGEIREIDLDKERFELRGVKQIGSIRCIKPKSLSGRDLIGEFCKVTGSYEVDKNGRPSLMMVDEISIEKPKQKDMDM